MQFIVRKELLRDEVRILNGIYPECIGFFQVLVSFSEAFSIRRYTGSCHPCASRDTTRIYFAVVGS